MTVTNELQQTHYHNCTSGLLMLKSVFSLVRSSPMHTHEGTKLKMNILLPASFSNLFLFFINHREQRWRVFVLVSVCACMCSFVCKIYQISLNNIPEKVIVRLTLTTCNYFGGSLIKKMLAQQSNFSKHKLTKLI